MKYRKWISTQSDAVWSLIVWIIILGEENWITIHVKIENMNNHTNRDIIINFNVSSIYYHTRWEI